MKHFECVDNQYLRPGFLRWLSGVEAIVEQEFSISGTSWLDVLVQLDDKNQNLLSIMKEVWHPPYLRAFYFLLKSDTDLYENRATYLDGTVLAQILFDDFDYCTGMGQAAPSESSPISFILSSQLLPTAPLSVRKNIADNMVFEYKGDSNKLKNFAMGLNSRMNDECTDKLAAYQSYNIFDLCFERRQHLVSDLISVFHKNHDAVALEPRQLCEIIICNAIRDAHIMLLRDDEPSALIPILMEVSELLFSEMGLDHDHSLRAFKDAVIVATIFPFPEHMKNAFCGKRPAAVFEPMAMESPLSMNLIYLVTRDVLGFDSMSNGIYNIIMLCEASGYSITQHDIEVLDQQHRYLTRGALDEMRMDSHPLYDILRDTVISRCLNRTRPLEAPDGLYYLRTLYDMKDEIGLRRLILSLHVDVMATSWSTTLEKELVDSITEEEKEFLVRDILSFSAENYSNILANLPLRYHDFKKSGLPVPKALSADMLKNDFGL